MPARTQALLPKDRIQDLYFDQGLSLSQVAEITGTNYRLVQDSFREHGLSWRTKSEARQGIRLSLETRRKLSRIRKGVKDPPEVAARKREFLKTAGGRGWNKGLTADTDERVARQRKAAVAVMRTKEWREARSRQKAAQIATGTYYKRGYHQSPKVGLVYFMSGWEERRWKELDGDDTVVTYEQHPCRIPYLWEGIQHLYLPDVLITYQDGVQVLEEIKPRKIVEEAKRKQNKTAKKLEAGEEYASNQGWKWRIFWYPGR